jgi:hypothetical protein
MTSTLILVAENESGRKQREIKNTREKYGSFVHQTMLYIYIYIYAKNNRFVFLCFTRARLVLLPLLVSFLFSSSRQTVQVKVLEEMAKVG